MSWLLWGLLLMLQSGCQTWVSRARNSRSLGYHAVASVGSHGAWFLGFVLAMDKVGDAKAAGYGLVLAYTAGFYVIVSMVGSVWMHHLLMTKVETGARKVGG
jgi:hypothetical protein